MVSAPIRVSTQTLGEQRVHLLEAGRRGAPEVMLIHGGLGDAELHWRSTLTTLSSSYHLYAPDLPGFREGSDALTAPTIPNLVRWLHVLLRTLGVERTALIGTSIGALLCRFYAAYYPTSVERLVLIDGGWIPNMSHIERALIAIPRSARWFYRLLYQRSYAPSALHRAIRKNDLLTESFRQTLERASFGYMSMMRAILSEPWPPMRMPACPTLIVWGREDHFAPLHHARTLRQELPQSHLTIIEECGHMPMLEQPQCFAEVVTEFLRSE